MKDNTVYTFKAWGFIHEAVADKGGAEGGHAPLPL